MGSNVSSSAHALELTNPELNLSANDVHTVREILLCFIPAKIVDRILNEAHYWMVTSAHREIPVRVRASDSTNNNASLCYLVCAPLPPSAKVRLVQFTTESHDQGWGGEAGLGGTYEGGHTWFDATIFRPCPTETESSHAAWLEMASSAPVEFPVPYDSALEVGTSKDGRTSRADRRWLIQTNRCADGELTRHTVIWEADSLLGAPKPWDGSGDGDGFIAQLKPGDQIGVIARAMYPGWVHHVKSVNVEVSYI
ncbi:hypothetical protein C8R44DRAFT_620192 [Mycena epipterygia]|nr:hypothetical protein C8R44DRAFT_620192 [Mycena epipterygia]